MPLMLRLPPEVEKQLEQCRDNESPSLSLQKWMLHHFSQYLLERTRAEQVQLTDEQWQRLQAVADFEAPGLSIDQWMANHFEAYIRRFERSRLDGKLSHDDAGNPVYLDGE